MFRFIYNFRKFPGLNIIPFTNATDSLQELDFNRSVCVAAMCYSDPIAPLSLTIIHGKFREDISLNILIYAITIRSKEFLRRSHHSFGGMTTISLAPRSDSVDR